MTTEALPAPTPPPSEEGQSRDNFKRFIRFFVFIGNEIKDSRKKQFFVLAIPLLALMASCTICPIQPNTLEKPPAPRVENSPDPVYSEQPPLSVETPNLSAQADSLAISYTVVEGDNLFRIALNHRVDLAMLAQANDITNWDLIFPGQKLTIPLTTSPVAQTVPAAESPEFFQVKAVEPATWQGANYADLAGLALPPTLTEQSWNLAIQACTDPNHLCNPFLLLAIQEKIQKQGILSTVQLDFGYIADATNKYGLSRAFELANPRAFSGLATTLNPDVFGHRFDDAEAIRMFVVARAWMDQASTNAQTRSKHLKTA